MTRRFRLLLLASITLNLVLFGMIAGLAVPHLKSRPVHISKAERSLRALTPERRRDIEEQMKQIQAQAKTDRERSNEARLAVTRAMRAPNFDRAVWENALRATFAQRDTERDAMVRRIGDLAEKLDQKERTALSRLLEENRPRPPRRH